jgi:hypothetical protein
MAIAPNTPKYIYSDGTTIAFDTGNYPVITYGRNVPADGSLFELGDGYTNMGAYGGYDARAQDMINEYNEELVFEGLTPVTLVSTTGTPPAEDTTPTETPPAEETPPTETSPITDDSIYLIEECINDTHDKFYIYMRQTWSDGSIRYYFKGKKIHAKNEKISRVKNIVDFDRNDPKLTLEYYFPDWFETGVDKKTYQTNYYGKMIEGPTEKVDDAYYSFYRWNKVSKKAIASKVKFTNCKAGPPQPKKVKGIVADANTNERIPNAKIDLNPKLYEYKQVSPPPKKTITADSKGEFEIELFPLTPISGSSEKPPHLFISQVNYMPEEYIPYKGNLSPKNDLGIILLTPSLKQLKPQMLQLEPKEIALMENQVKKPKDYSMFLKILNKILTILLPLLLALLAAFGIKKLMEKLPDKIECPDEEKLKEIIKKKNNLTKQLNQLLTSIDTATKILGITGGIIEMFSMIYNLLKINPTPMVNGMPLNVPGLLQDTKNDLDKTLSKLRGINSGILTILILLRSILIKVLNKMDLLDQALQQCCPDSEEFQEELSQELLALKEQIALQDNSPVITIVNGFTMDVEQEITDKPLKRRRSIAKDTSGVTVLKGEWSFSSIDQILIDELVFYIQTNNLKAN